MNLVFPSCEYIFLFLPAVLAGYHLLRRFAPAGKVRWDELWLLAASLLFYLSFGAENFCILVTQAVLGYIILTILIRHHPLAGISEDIGFRDGIVTGIPDPGSIRYAGKITSGVYLVGVGLLLFLLGFYKYFSPVMPIAISFTTFSLIELLSEAREGELTEVKPLDYLLFFFFFPKLLQGPIMRYDEFRGCLADRRSESTVTPGFAPALLYFVLGLAKKVLIADRLAVAVNLGWDAPEELLWSEAVLTVLCYSLQIYFDFSGYCDMGRAAAWMLGFDLPVNFDKPYRATDIRDFWHRWHRSLTQFLTVRLYFPLGGSRVGKLKTLLNTMIVFLLSGLWHGEGLTFLVWGALHGAASCVHRVTSDLSGTHRHTESAEVPQGMPAEALRESKPLRSLRIILTFVFVTFAWIFFRAPSLTAAFVMSGKIFDKPWFVLHDRFINCFLVNELWYPLKVLGVPDARTGGIICLWLLIGFAALAAFLLPSAEAIARRLGDVLTGKAKGIVVILASVLTAGLFIWCVFSLGEVASFLYFDF